MKILIVGGTRFVGRHIVAEALKRKHQVSMFNRGNNRDIFTDLEWLSGDRNSDVSSLKGKSFDAVIDTCGYTPQQLELTNSVLNQTPHYTFISTISVYSEPLPSFADETAALAQLEQPTTEVTNESYGALKVLCEQDIKRTFTNALILRPGIIVGPYDPTDRFTYWVWRTAQGGTMLAPGRINAPLQFIDARDFARFTLDSIEKSLNGTFNVVTPANALCFGDMIETTLEISKADTTINWVGESFLETQENLDLPLYVPEAYQSWWQVSSKRAVSDGLSFHTLEQTISDILNWISSMETYKPKAGLSDAQEKKLLEDWERYPAHSSQLGIANHRKEKLVNGK
jgi:2'-hydroxyisoflavone reductase